MEVLIFLTGAALGAVVCYLFFQKNSSGNELLEDYRQQILKLENRLDELRAQLLESNSNFTRNNTENKLLKEKLAESKKEMLDVQKKLSADFQNMANQLLEEKSQKFTEQNRRQIRDLLDPLGIKISQFEKKVEETNKENIQRNSALREQLNNLKEMNIQVSRETENLTKALKGDTKTQGNWGEFILEKILERSGLRKDYEFSVQNSFTQDNGKRSQPDVIINLPDNKHIVIDSKVSITAFEKYINSDSEESFAFLKAHLQSIRNHCRLLSQKNYQDLHGIQGLDFVLLFIPLEPAFSLAVKEDERLFQDAFDQNIVIVSPSTLLATLRTIASIWKNEYQNRNAREIAKNCGDLYNKFVGFTEDLESIGKHLRQTNQAYDSALNKLKTGKGNLIRRAEKIKDMGIRSNKNIKQEWLDEQPKDRLD